MTRMPSWLVDHIETTTGAAPGARKAKPRRCSGCGEKILAGLDGDFAAFDVEADPVPLGVAGEAIALLAGRDTYALRRAGQAWTLHRRDRWQIGGGRRKRFDVLAAHVCGEPLTEWAVPSTIPVYRLPKETSDRPPF